MISGGVRRISHITEVLVPVMAVVYLLLGIEVVAIDITDLPRVLADIVGGAFGLREVVGGGIGTALAQGIRRGMFSNEAGLGSSPNAAAAADVSHPVKQGLVQSLGVYFDTLLICSITAFRILVLVAVFGGALGSVSLIWNLADVFMGVMALVNLAAIIPLGVVAFGLLADYRAQRSAGEDPVYVHSADIADPAGVQCWQATIASSLPGKPAH